jgi:hypothetical protein
MLAAACQILLETPGPDVLSVLRPVEVARWKSPAAAARVAMTEPIASAP